MDSWPVSRLAAFLAGCLAVCGAVYVLCWQIGIKNLSEKRILSRQAAAGRIILALSAYDKAKERGEWGFF